MSRKLTQYENFLVKKFELRPERVTNRSIIFSNALLYAADQKHRAEKAAAEQKALQTAIKSDSEYFTSPEFRQDVIAELLVKGATMEQAQNRTRDQVRLFAEATKLGLM